MNENESTDELDSFLTLILRPTCHLLIIFAFFSFIGEIHDISEIMNQCLEWFGN
jgi:hypothetical protein